MASSHPKTSPAGLEPGDRFEHPWGELEVQDVRGDDDGEDTREWHVRDVETGEEMWVEFDFLLELAVANIKKPFSAHKVQPPKRMW